MGGVSDEFWGLYRERYYSGPTGEVKNVGGIVKYNVCKMDMADWGSRFIIFV